MKKISHLLLTILCLIPTIVFASNGSSEFDIKTAIFIEAFVSIHMSAFVLFPLAKLYSNPGEEKKIFKILFIIRVIILLYCDFFITPYIAIVDFVAVFIGTFLVVPICTSIKNKTPLIILNSNIYTSTKPQIINSSNISAQPIKQPILVCKKCGAEVTPNLEKCPNCNTPCIDNTITKFIDTKKLQSSNGKILLSSDFDNMYNLSEDKMLEEFIKKELIKAGSDINLKLIPQNVLKKKIIFNIIFSVLLLALITSIFFHLKFSVYIIGAIILILFFILTRRYNFIKYLSKEIKSRPSEKISNIIMNAKMNLIEDNSNKILLIGILISVILPVVIFMNPRIFYEKIEGGYAVRFYTFGIKNYTSVTIPETYKGEKVVSLRGTTFSNMPFLTEIKLPDTITEIRGRAFENDYNLVKINIPNNLTYLGGGAFSNCTSLQSVILPDTLTYMGGETFYNATSLNHVKLSNSLTEIRGNTFENCYSLTSITIPDSVTRIGAHAFRANESLREVIFTENSQLNEIGSSAFRECYNLSEIHLPNNENMQINERAFKDSPTKVKIYTKEYESGFNQYEHGYKKNEFSINNGDNVISYSKTQSLYYVEENEKNVTFVATITNPKKHKLEFDIIIEYFDENYESIATCPSHVNFDKYYGVLESTIVTCETYEYQLEKSCHDIKYYKVYTENTNIDILN